MEEEARIIQVNQMREMGNPPSKMNRLSKEALFNLIITRKHKKQHLTPLANSTKDLRLQ